MADTECIEARLRHLLRQLDDFGVRRKDTDRTWDELVDLYNHALEEAATLVGIDVPGAPTSMGRRFTRQAREEIEAALAVRGVLVR